MLEVLAMIGAAIIAAIGAVVAAYYGASAKQRQSEIERFDRKLARVESDIWTAIRRLPDAHPTRREWKLMDRAVEKLTDDIQGLRDKIDSDTERILEAVRAIRAEK